MILVLTLANKPALLLDALDSVRRQTRRDFRHIVHLDGGDCPLGVYPPSRFLNVHALAAGRHDYVCWLSDDDLLEPTYLETLAGFLDDNPDVLACYGGTRQVTYDPATGASRLIREIPAAEPYSAARSPSCQIDGGQVLLRRRLLDLIPEPWCPEGLTDCNISDGLFLQKLAQVTTIEPVVGSWVMQNRVTPLSSHWRLVNGEPDFYSPETVRRLRG